MGGFTYGALPGQSSAGGYDAFVTLYDKDGNLQWPRQLGTAGYDRVDAVAADGSVTVPQVGEVEVAGLDLATATWSATALQLHLERETPRP